MYNKKVLIDSLKNLGSAKAPTKQKDKIYTNNDALSPFVSSEGFKQGPPPSGSHYRIPGDTLYNPTPYSIDAVSDNGIRKTLKPYDTRKIHFPGATHVDEYEKKKIKQSYPEGRNVEKEFISSKKGGETRRVKLPNKKNSKGYSRSLEATNKFFTENRFFAKPKSRKNKVYDPNSQYYQNGGNYFSYEGRPDAKYMKKNDGWYINAPGTNGQYIKVEDPTGSRTKLLNEQAVYHSGTKAKSASSSIMGNVTDAFQNVINPINSDILKVGESISGGGYNKAFTGSGTPFVISHNGQEILPAATDGTYCSGYTCGVSMKVLQQRGLLDTMTPSQLKNFQKTWYGAKDFEKGKSETLSTKALEDYNLGKRIEHKEAKSGDIAQIWRNNGSGHSVIFKDWVTDDKGNRIGIKYRSSQANTKGVGDRTEMFDNNIDPDRIYVARLNNRSQGGNVTTGHFQRGGATSPEAWGQEIKDIEGQIGNPANWTMDDYYLLQDKLNAYKDWRENTPEGQTVIDSHNEEGEYDIPLPEHLQDYTNAMMKSKLAYANEFGNPAAKRMINLPDNPYQFDSGDTGTHYMASMDNYAVPQIQDENGELMLGDYGPDSKEAIRFDSDEDARYFAEHYKDVSPGFVNAELTQNQIQEYAKGGYIIEDISVPELTQAQFGGLAKYIPKLPPITVPSVLKSTYKINPLALKSVPFGIENYFQNGEQLQPHWLRGFPKVVNKVTSNEFNDIASQIGYGKNYPSGPATDMEMTKLYDILSKTRSKNNLFTNSFYQPKKYPLTSLKRYSSNIPKTEVGSIKPSELFPNTLYAQPSRRNNFNYETYGGYDKNWKEKAFFAGLFGTTLGLGTAVGVGILADDPTKNSINRKIGYPLYITNLMSDPNVTQKDTLINLNDNQLGYGQMKDSPEARILLGGDFVGDEENTVRPAKDWLHAKYGDTYGDNDFKTKDIKSFYGIENGTLKLGSAKDFKSNTKIVPNRYDDGRYINKAKIADGQLRLVGNDGQPIYHNTTNSGGKIIFHSKDNNKSIFISYSPENVNKTVNQINNFIKDNKNVKPIVIDNGRYIQWMQNNEGITDQNYSNFYSNDIQRGSNSGYNITIKKDGGSMDKGGFLKRKKRQPEQMEPIEIIQPGQDVFPLPETSQKELWYDPITLKEMTPEELKDYTKAYKEKLKKEKFEADKLAQPGYFDEAKQWVSDWHDSPMYNKMVLNSYAGNQKNADYTTKLRKKNINTMPSLNIKEEGEVSDYGFVPAAHSMNDTGQIEVFSGGYDYGPALYTHEILHSSDRPRELYKWDHPSYTKYNEDGSSYLDYPSWMLYNDPRFPTENVWHDRTMPKSDQMYITKHRASNWKDNERYKINAKENYPLKSDDQLKQEMLESKYTPEEIPEYFDDYKKQEKEIVKELINIDKEDWKEFGHGYVSNPTEVRARLGEIRFHAQKEGIYDPFTEQITPEIFQNYINKKRDSENWQPLKPIDELREEFTDEEILWMLQNISKNDNTSPQTEDEPQYTKQGGSIGYELGDEVNEATMEKLKKLGYTFQMVK